jgi:hypothetical protein
MHISYSQVPIPSPSRSVAIGSRHLAKNPDLRFYVTTVCRGVETIVIAYQNQKGENRVEVLTFGDGLVISSHGGRGYNF